MFHRIVNILLLTGLLLWATSAPAYLEPEWEPVWDKGANSDSIGVTGKTWTEPVTGMEFVWVPGGCFQMGSTDGSSDEKPVHEVCVGGFWMGKTEVTQGQWQKIMGSNPSRFKNGDNYPVERVSWNDAQDFIGKLSGRGSKRLRLPTEAEWEYAARSGGKDQKFAGGYNIDEVAWHTGNSGSQTHPVAQKRPNGLGLFDTSGNVWEWCQDWYNEGTYRNSFRKNPKGPTSGSSRVLRGGSWNDISWNCRSTDRGGYGPDVRDIDFLGFRLVVPAGQ